jgi:2-hydroxychromene-2-carboxylate isomerase
MPILLGGLFKLAGIKANVDIPAKGKYMIKDCKLFAEKHNITFKFNSYFPILTLNLMRSVLVAEKKGFAQNFIDKVFDAVWVDGLNLNDINPRNFLLESGDNQIKEDLKKRTEDAFSKGIFGAPSFIINNKIFWGQDRLEFVLKEAKK